MTTFCSGGYTLSLNILVSILLAIERVSEQWPAVHRRSSFYDFCIWHGEVTSAKLLSRSSSINGSFLESSKIQLKK